MEPQEAARIIERVKNDDRHVWTTVTREAFNTSIQALRSEGCEKCNEWERIFDRILPGCLLQVRDDRGFYYTAYPRALDPRRKQKPEYRDDGEWRL